LTLTDSPTNDPALPPDDNDHPSDQAERAPFDDLLSLADEADQAVPPPPFVDARPLGTRRQPPRRRMPPVEPAPRRGYGCADVLTAIFLLLAVGVAAWTILLIANARSPLNPFPPRTFPAQIVLATPFPTDMPTMTPTTTPTIPTETPTSLPTSTATSRPTITATPVVGGGLAIQRPTPTPISSAPIYTPSPSAFTAGPIIYTTNGSDTKCQYQGIRGSVVDLQGNPLDGLTLRFTGGDNKRVDEFKFTNQPPTLGKGNFEIILGAEPREETFTVQLLSKTGAPISDIIQVKTRTGCNQNVAIVNFVQNHQY
jgi:hypothetical protein